MHSSTCIHTFLCTSGSIPQVSSRGNSASAAPASTVNMCEQGDGPSSSTSNTVQDLDADFSCILPKV